MVQPKYIPQLDRCCRYEFSIRIFHTGNQTLQFGVVTTDYELRELNRHGNRQNPTLPSGAGAPVEPLFISSDKCLYRILLSVLLAYGAILVDEDLTRAVLTGANLERAILVDAKLPTARLNRVNLTGANQ